MAIRKPTLAQALPENRKTNLSSAGNSGNQIAPANNINITDFGGTGNGIHANDAAIASAINSLSGAGGIITFPSGTFLFNAPIVLRSDIVLKGAGSEQTTLKFSNNVANSHLISATGTTTTIKTPFAQNGVRHSNQIQVVSVNGLAVGNYIRIGQNDASLVFSSWAVGSVGQIERITNIQNQTITIASTLRLDYPLSRMPSVTKILPQSNIGIECLKIERVAISTDPVIQVSNIYFNKVVESHVRGVESNIGSFAHIQLDESANIEVSESWFHHGLDYGSGGRAYGIVCQSATNLCLVVNNIFNHLRHSYLLQAGANGNVLAYNFSTDPFRSELPSDFAGDIVLHGNYVFSNLAEGNIASHIILDDSHGANGPDNLVLRNRVNGLGIWNLSANSQNFIGNEIAGNKSYMSSPVPNWHITGTDHYLTGNRVRATDGSGQYVNQNPGSTTADVSFFYSQKPSFFKLNNAWPLFGTNNMPDLTITNDAAKRYISSSKTVCPESTPLPVSLLSFTSNPDKCNVNLNWKTAEESDFSHFDIEKSLDGIRFEKIGSVSKSENHTYSFRDDHAANGNNYYRLKMVDIDGSYAYSHKIYTVANCNENEIFVFPVITSDYVTLNNLIGNETIQLFDVGGHERDFTPERDLKRIVLRNFPAGLYVIVISNPNGFQRRFKVAKTL